MLLASGGMDANGNSNAASSAQGNLGVKSSFTAHEGPGGVISNSDNFNNGTSSISSTVGNSNTVKVTPPQTGSDESFLRHRVNRNIVQFDIVE